MRIASFNVENLFQRAIALNLPTFEAGRKALEQQAELNALFNQPKYSAADNAKMIALLTALGLAHSDDGGEFALLRQNRGHLLQRPAGGTLQIVAKGRADWIGWVELKMQPVDELATRHTAMVIRDVQPDILGVVEAESRAALKDFSDRLLPAVGGAAFRHVMLIDGNDNRGIDVGLTTKQGYEIEGIRSHVDDADAQGTIFSRDCPEYTVAVPGGERLVVLVNHLKSKGFGVQTENDAKRKRQAQRVAAIYQRLRAAGEKNVVVLGDFNDTPGSAPLAPLLSATDLKDISSHPKFAGDGRPGTYGDGTSKDKFDFILLAPALFAKVTGGGVFRKGVWGGKDGKLFAHYPTIVHEYQAASDHAAIFADLNL